MNAIENLLSLAQAYAAASNVEATTLSSRMFNDGKKLAAIEAGASLTVDRYERAIQWLSDNWPPSARWPSHITRPTKTAEPARAAS